MFSSNQTNKKYFLIAFAASCLLLQVFTFIVYQESLAIKGSYESFFQDYQKLDTTNQLLNTSMAMADSKAGGTGAQAQLALRQRLNQNLASLKDLTADDASAPVPPILRSSANVTQMLADAQSYYKTFSAYENELIQKHMLLASQRREKFLRTLVVSDVLSLGIIILANLVVFGMLARNNRMEEELGKKDKLFSMILEGVNDGVYDYDVTKDTVSYSSYARILGYDGDQLFGEHDKFYDLMHPDDVQEARACMADYFARRIPTYYNIFRIRHKDGHWVWLMSRGIGIWDKNGNITRLVGTHTDITAQKEREEELARVLAENEQHQQELAISKEKAEAASVAKSEFLATMSHEIRTPLNVVTGLSRLLLGTNLGAKQKEMADLLRANADTLLQLINSILDLSRMESGQIQLEIKPFLFVHIFASLRSMFELQAKDKGLQLILTDNADRMFFLGDGDRVLQILINLVGNAIKFTSSGSISVTVDAQHKQGNLYDVVLHVVDTGIGISEEKIHFIFDKFVQADQTISRRFGGSGLGLTICKSLTAMMGGQIKVTSMAGQGTSFVITLPLPQVEVEQKAQAPDAAVTGSSATESKQLLLVEDYEANIMVATYILNDLGYDVDVARSGSEAIKKVEGRTTPYSAILMDVQMQDMNGYETTRNVRVIEKAKGFRHTIIGLTAHALMGDRAKCLQAGMDDYMTKPINPEILAQKLKAA